MQGSEIGREAEEIVKSGGEFTIAALGWGCRTLADTLIGSCIDAILGPLFVLIAPGMVLFGRPRL